MILFCSLQSSLQSRSGNNWYRAPAGTGSCDRSQGCKIAHVDYQGSAGVTNCRHVCQVSYVVLHYPLGLIELCRLFCLQRLPSAIHGDSDVPGASQPGSAAGRIKFGHTAACKSAPICRLPSGVGKFKHRQQAVLPQSRVGQCQSVNYRITPHTGSSMFFRHHTTFCLSELPTSGLQMRTVLAAPAVVNEGSRGWGLAQSADASSASSMFTSLPVARCHMNTWPSSDPDTMTSPSRPITATCKEVCPVQHSRERLHDHEQATTEQCQQLAGCVETRHGIDECQLPGRPVDNLPSAQQKTNHVVCMQGCKRRSLDKVSHATMRPWESLMMEGSLVCDQPCDMCCDCNGPRSTG